MDAPAAEDATRGEEEKGQSSRETKRQRTATTPQTDPTPTGSPAPHPLFSLVACGAATHPAKRRRGRAIGGGSEDRFAVQRLTREGYASSSEHWFAAVFDGHGGHEAAEMAANTMHTHVAAAIHAEPSEEWAHLDAANWCIADDPAHSAGESAAAAREEAAAKLMASAFRVTDDAVLDAGIDSGSTGCTALVGRRGIIIANAGDSRAILCCRSVSTPVADAEEDDGGAAATPDAARAANADTDTDATQDDTADVANADTSASAPKDVSAGDTATFGIEVMRLSTDHTPDLQNERLRIEEAGGMVLKVGGAARVCAETSPVMLAVSRALGDRSLKFAGTIPRGLVTDEPECIFRRCDGTELLLVIVSDGVTDVLDDETIARTALNAARSVGASTAEEAASAMAEAVVKLSVERNSPDDITAVAVVLHDDAWRAADSGGGAVSVLSSAPQQDSDGGIPASDNAEEWCNP